MALLWLLLRTLRLGMASPFRRRGLPAAAG
jgi:hypothetical protein